MNLFNKLSYIVEIISTDNIKQKTIINIELMVINNNNFELRY
jgi:hypothetical protein